MSKPPFAGLRPAGEGDGLRELELGPELVARFHGVLRGMRLYDAANQAVLGQLKELMTALGTVMSPEATLVGMGDYFYLNGVRLKPDASHMSIFRAAMSELTHRELGGLRFLEGLTQGELEAFLKLFVAARDPGRGAGLADQATAMGIVHIVPIRIHELSSQVQGTDETEGGEAAGERGRARKTFWGAVHGTKDVLMRSARGGRPALQQARRVVQPVVDRIMKNEYSIVGLTALKNHDEYTYVHCVNVSVLSIRMGQVLGFARQALANLGAAALLHDVGKIAVPAEVLAKPGALTPEEWGHIHRHPIEGVKLLSRFPVLSSLMLDSMRVAFQHHMNMDFSGYPKVPDGSTPSTVSRIVATADFFDAVTSHRAYRARPMTTFEALRLLVGTQRAHFDPATLWALVQTVGLYPAGSVLLTASGHLVLVLSPNPRDLRRPTCRIVERPAETSGAAAEGEIWDPMPESERVVRVLPPEELSIDVNALLAA